MQRDLKIAGGVSSVLSCETGICSGEFLSMMFPPIPKFCCICCIYFTEQKRSASESCPKIADSDEIGGKRANSF